MNTVYLINGDTAEFSVHNIEENLVAFLQSKWSRFPDNAAIYYGRIDPLNEVTPRTEDDLSILQRLRGLFYVVQNAGDPTTIGYIAIALIAVIALTGKTPDIPTIRNRQSESPNNDLSDRQNRIRLNERIPDIFGEVISTPDLIAVPYFVYVNHRKVEHAYMCVGRGSYLFGDIRDGDTLISEIEGAGIEIYGPNQSPNNASPIATIGDAITEPIIAAKRVDAVNGQTLLAPNENDILLDGLIVFAKNNKIEADPGSSIDFTTVVTGTDVSISAPDYRDAYEALYEGQPIAWSISGCTYNGGTIDYTNITSPVAGCAPLMAVSLSWTMLIAAVSTLVTGIFMVVSNTIDGFDVGHLVLHDPEERFSGLASHTGTSEEFQFDGYNYHKVMNFSGSYTASSVTAKTITLTTPINDNPDWYFQDRLGTDYATTAAGYYEALGIVLVSGYSEAVVDNWIGPFTINLPGMNGVIANIVALQGMYKDDGTDQTSTSVEVQIELTPVNSSGAAIAAPTVLTGTVTGTELTRAERAITIRDDSLADVSRYKVRARRVTPKDTAYSGQIADEVKWADLYGLQSVTDDHFGNITTIKSMTTATAGALAIKSRKLNARVTRKVLIIEGDDTLAASITPSKRGCDIIAHICLDPYIGNRTADEVDLANLRAVCDAIEAYFGHSVAQQFCYTFAKANMSFEETIEIVANALHCVAYREGKVIKIQFEKETEDSILLFTHRNKIPKSETRTYQFGTNGDIDGIEFEYTSPDDGAEITYYIPTDRSAANPKKIEMPGIAHPLQAYFLAWRAWNKILYQRCIVEFNATQEAEILLRNNRVLVSDGTRPMVQDGEVRGLTGLVITTSQPVSFAGGLDHTVFLQHIDGTVQAIAATAGANEYEITLGTAPSAALSLDPENFALATYMLVNEDEVWPRAFLVQERDTSDTLVSKLTAVNYDSRYYANDDDYIVEVIGENGELL